MQNYSVKINDNSYLTYVSVSKNSQPTKAPEIPINHVAIIDCSGSMYSDLPKIREQLKLKLPKLLGEKDTISIIWFSSRGEFGTLIKGEFISTLKDLSDINKAIDRWLKPNCLTGFKEPLEEAARIVEDIQKKNPGVCSLFFMSDGYENQHSQADILAAMEKAAGKYASTTIVEYGYYCNRALMALMAQKAGAALIFSEDFDKYEPAFEATIGKKVSGAPRIEIDLHDTPTGNFAFAMHGSELITFSVDNNKILVPEDFDGVYYISSSPLNAKNKNLSDLCKSLADEMKSSPNAYTSFGLDQSYPGIRAAYAAMSLYGQRMQSDVVYTLLRATGDTKLINKFSTCFGKQLYSDFCDLTSGIALSSAGIFAEGRDPNKVPKDDAFTVLDLLHILSEDENNRILFEHPQFKYSRIGRGKIDSSDILTEEERTEIADLTAKMNATKIASDAKKHKARIDEILESKKAALKFVADPAPNGYSISALKTNEERPNISVLVNKSGTVDLSSRLPSEYTGKIPSSFPTFIWRNYAIIADGLVNVELLPCKINSSTSKLLQKAGIPSDSMYTDGPGSDVVIFKLRQIPVINRNMVKSVSARALFEQEFNLTKLRAVQKVYNTYVKEKLPARGTTGIAATYGTDAAAWLKEQGITDGGFNPKVVQAESTDFYMGKELDVKIKGYSKLPSLKELKEMVTKKKVNAPGALMQSTYEEVEKFLNSDVFTKAADQNSVLEAWLDSQAKATTNMVRQLLFLKAQQVFSIIVGQIWPTEFASLDENALSVTVDNNKIDGTMTLKEIQIKI